MKYKELTPKEYDICRWCIENEGRISYQKIADDLCIARSTANTHINNINKKLLINSKSELVFYIMKNIPQLMDLT